MNHEDIRVLRLARHLSQEALGRMIGVPQERISLIERGLPPTEDEKRLILEALTSERDSQ